LKDRALGESATGDRPSSTTTSKWQEGDALYRLRINVRVQEESKKGKRTSSIRGSREGAGGKQPLTKKKIFRAQADIILSAGGGEPESEADDGSKKLNQGKIIKKGIHVPRPSPAIESVYLRSIKFWAKEEEKKYGRGDRRNSLEAQDPSPKRHIPPPDSDFDALDPTKGEKRRCKKREKGGGQKRQSDAGK